MICLAKIVPYLCCLLICKVQGQSDPSEALWKPWLDLFTFGNSDALLNLGKKGTLTGDFIAHDVPQAPPPFKPPPPPAFSTSVSNALRAPGQSQSQFGAPPNQQSLYDFDNFGLKLGNQNRIPANIANNNVNKNPFNFGANNNANNNQFNVGTNSNANNNPFNLPQAQNFEFLGENFGVPKGKDCIPYIGGVIKLLWRDCQKKAEALTWGQLGNQIQIALQGGKIDYTGALRETCKLQADRNFCQALGKKILNCDIMGTLAQTIEIQQAKERCDKIENFFQTARSDNVLGNIGNLIGSEVGSALIRNFFQG